MSAELKVVIRALAREEGFVRCRVSGPEIPPEALRRYRAWLEEGSAGGLDYLRGHLDLRSDPRRLVHGTRSLLCLAAGYAPPGPAPGLVSLYARGRDYHRVLKRRARRLMDRIRAELSAEFTGRAFVDSAPVMERTLALRSGVGRRGGHGGVIVPGCGSFAFLCEVFCNLELPPDGPLSPPGCDACGRCAAACPTGALRSDGLVDARRCISYLTIEHRGPIGPEIGRTMGVRLFGCDACQLACPHNEGVRPGLRELTGPYAPGATTGIAEVLDWTRDDWDRATRGSALRRADFEMWVRNAAIAATNASRRDLTERASRALGRCERLGKPMRWTLEVLRGG